MNNCCGKSFEFAYCPRCGKKVGSEEPLFELLKYCQAMQKQSLVRIARCEQKLGSTYPTGIPEVEERALAWLATGRRSRKNAKPVSSEAGKAAKDLVRQRLTYAKWSRWIAALTATTQGKTGRDAKS